MILTTGTKFQLKRPKNANLFRAKSLKKSTQNLNQIHEQI